MNENQISAILAEKIPALKEVACFVHGMPSTSKDKSRKEPEPPNFWEGYKRTVDMCMEIMPHSERGFFPERLFRKKAPNQSNEEFEYFKQVFKLLGTPTHSYWAKAMSKINRIWNEKNYSIKYPEIEAVEYSAYPAKDYFEKDYPQYTSIEDFFKEVVTSKKIADPNAWAVLDVMLPVIEEGDEVMIDQSVPVMPHVCIVDSCMVVGYSDHWLLNLTHEHSWVEYGQTKVKEGLILEFRDATGLYRIEQVGKKIDWQFSEPELIYEWNLEVMPCRRLKGRPVYAGHNLIYESYFAPAVSELNTALVDSNTLQVSKIAHAFPEPWEYVDDCEAEGCRSGYISTYDEGVEKISRCRSCNGTGRKNFSSPLSVIEVPVPKDGIAGSVQSDKLSPPFKGYVQKAEAVEMMRFLREEVRERCENAFAFINIDVSNSEVQGSDTALGKQIDREELFSFLMQISNEDFSLLGFFINLSGVVRYGPKWQDVEIGYPQNFAIRSDEDLTTELTEAKNAGIPTIAQQSLMKEYMGSRFNNRSDMDRVFTLISKVDRLYTFTPMEIVQKLSAQIVAPWEAILHDSIDQLILLAQDENESFWDMETEQQKQLLVDKAKVIASEITPKKLNMEDILRPPLPEA